jgi:16S rRNA (guanine527-N7)-methyltransferase
MEDLRAHGIDVSHETGKKLDLFIEELHRWQRIKNLVAERSLPEAWHRHVSDSLQLLDIEPKAKRWLDLGSGAGFPGLVLGIALSTQAGCTVHLVESNSRKCAFLRHVARVTGAAVEVHDGRAESILPRFAGEIDVVTARAVAPLGTLIEWSHPLLTTGSVGLFPKGRNVAAELTSARESWRFESELFPSRTDSAARVVRLTQVAPVQLRASEEPR